MRILITTGLSGNDIGGPLQYAPRLEEEFKSLNNQVRIVAYDRVEKMLPPGLRHIYFFLKIFPSCIWSDKILLLDTFSVGVPTVFASRILAKKCIVRVGGDFLWSAYVNRTSGRVTLSAFYQEMPRLNLKERLILFFTRRLIGSVDYLAFNTEWQKKIWSNFYKIPENKTSVVRNFLPKKSDGEMPAVKNFLWAGRAIPEKNIELLEKLGKRIVEKHPDVRLDIVTGEPPWQVLGRVKSCYVAMSVAFTDICPNFILEAAAYNKPFIMTNETGFREIYPTSGIFINPLDEEESMRAMETMLDEGRYKTFVEELKKVDLRQTWKDMAEKYLEIWKTI